ncbi:MAG: UDP-N-acetylmuramyl-tripeptide synthetase [Microgenomates bacterium 39_7]|nr:MAG: UDP-N-acetylmuramyl-tripeptide synthetase [Microgenomates bacterium 39_7]
MRQFIYFLKRPYHFVKTGLFRGTWGQLKYRFPAKKINVIAITGTDGKTTTSSLIFHILNSSKKKTGLISTVVAKIGNKEIDTGLHVTAPDPLQLNQFLREMVDEKCEYAVLEMTSHGAYQYRDWGIKPIIAGLTNVTHEHLDYHPDYDRYIDAKCLLLRKAPVAVINEDDRSFYKIRQRLDLKQQEVDSFSMDEKLPPSINKAINKRFPEPYNHANARLAVKITQLLEIDDKDIASAIITFPGVEGRMQEIDVGQKFRVVVDFAHTPNAIDQALSALKLQLKKQKKKGKLIALFGSAGKRDVTKRPNMGQAAVKNADIVIITADDPRNEDIWSIIHQIKSGVKDDHQKIVSITDRYQAIKFALTQLAQPGDIVALLGKGAEKSLAIGKQEIPWSDQKVAEQIIKESLLKK